MKKRMGNACLIKPYDDHPVCDVVIYYPSPYFGKESEYEKDLLTGMMVSKGGCRVSAEIFQKKELCYTVCYIRKGVVDFIGNRIFELETSDMRDVLWLIRDGINWTRDRHPGGGNS